MRDEVKILNDKLTITLEKNKPKKNLGKP